MNNDNHETVKVTLPKDTGLPRITINNINDLPDWFDKDNYLKSAKMTAKEWYKELEIRALFYSIADVNENIDIFHIVASIRDCRTRSQYFGCTNLYPEDKEKLMNEIDRDTVQIEDENVVFCKVISDLSIYDSELLQSILDYTSSSFTLDWKSIYNDLELNLCTPDNCLIEIYSKSNNFNEDIENFKKWLCIERKNKLNTLKKSRTPLAKQIITEGSKIQRIDECQLSGFYLCGLLPFLDLHQWVLLNNYKITQDIFAEAVLPITQDIGSSRFGENTITKGENIVAIMEVLRNQILSDEMYPPTADTN